MNKTNFNQTGGFPLKTERLQEMETAYSIFNAFRSLAGDLTIISGCTLNGSTIGDGKVYINNELLDFKQAAVTPTSTVVIIEEAVNRGFKNGVVKTVHTKRYATFGTAEASWLWSNFKRVDAMSVMMARLDVMEKKTAVFQAGGGMVLWNLPAADIPTGWQEVVDWRGRMPVGFDENQTEFNTMGKTGGAKNKKLSVNELPPHKHTISQQSNDQGGSGKVTVGGSASEGTNPSTDNAGGGEQFSLLNPYRVVLFIEFIG